MLRSVLGGIAATIIAAPLVGWLSPPTLLAGMLGGAAYCIGMVIGARTVR